MKYETLGQRLRLEKRYRNAAAKKHKSDENVTVDLTPTVFVAANGAYVQTWTWIPKETL